MFSRSSGVLLHVSSLPGPYGIGDLGPEAWKWAEWLASAGSKYWQILPLGPPGFGNSPYSSPSSFAGNIDLISPDLLYEQGLIDRPDPIGRVKRVDYPTIRAAKQDMIAEAHARQTGSLREDFNHFRELEAAWLDPFSLFMALKDVNGGQAWPGWHDQLRTRDPEAMVGAAKDLREEIELHAFGQFVFYRHLERMRQHAASAGVEIIGDVPLYVAHDSVDVWTRPELFAIHSLSGEPYSIAGVPPDRFSPVGQVWGTPTYRWENIAADGYRWWVDRMCAFQRHADVLRIDHFTGFSRYYTVDPVRRDPTTGRWLEGPGPAPFRALEKRLGATPIIVEDLGPLGAEVERLRASLGFPGMRVLQQAFDPDAGEINTPTLYPEDCVVYTGTHDNETARGRLATADEGYRRRALAFTGGGAETFARDLVARAWESTPVIAIAPLQDLLDLGAEHRMNTPGTVDGNWEWRATPGSFDHTGALRLADLNRSTGRHG